MEENESTAEESSIDIEIKNDPKAVVDGWYQCSAAGFSRPVKAESQEIAESYFRTISRVLSVLRLRSEYQLADSSHIILKSHCIR